MRTWTDEETKYLRKHYNNIPVGTLASTLGRSAQSIRNKVHIMRKKGFTFDRKTNEKNTT